MKKKKSMELKGKMDRFIIKVEDTNKFHWIPGNNKETKPKLLIFYAIGD